jgi:uncharacterized protein YkwD
MGLSRLGLALGVVACTGELRSEGPSLDSIPDAGTFPSDAARPDPVPPPDAAQRSDAWQPPDAWSPPESGCDDPVEQEAIRLVNTDRSARGLRTVRCDPAMTAVAREHSTDMCRRGYFDHTGLDGRDPFDRLRDGGVRFSSAGENIAWGQRSAVEVHDAWMHSPGHRRNILDGDYGRIGVGLDRCGGDMYWTQVFAN